MSDRSARLAVRLRIFGRVQGVAFRAAMQREAHSLGLAGWVRNRADGSVEALAAGPSPDLARLELWAAHGPPAARVQRVVREPADPPEAGGFDVLPTI